MSICLNMVRLLELEPGAHEENLGHRFIQTQMSEVCPRTVLVSLSIRRFVPTTRASSHNVLTLQNTLIVSCDRFSSMDDPDQTVVTSDQKLPSNAEVQNAIQDYVLTLGPKLRVLDQYVSSHNTLMEAATLTACTDLRESRTRVQRTQSPRCHLRVCRRSRTRGHAACVRSANGL
jgi:hypothetical protein